MNPKLLCIDDEPDILDSLERVLRLDFQILKAASAAEAEQILKTQLDLAVVLSDQRMPGTNGVDFLRQVRALAPNALRALLSGQMDLQDMARAVNSGLVHRIVLKPWDNEYLRIQMLEAYSEHQLLAEKSQLERLAVTDPITQLVNHRYFQERLKNEIDRANRHSRPCSLLMIDIDHFKQFNDRLGHPEGDLLLADVARKLLDAVRSIDVVARYGGDEFSIIMPDTRPEEAALVAERIRASFDNNNSAGPMPNQITLSLGVASYPLHGKTASGLIVQADVALYQAKGQGRNRVSVASVTRAK